MGGESVRLDGNTLVLPGGVGVRFIRTLRLPEEGTHPLPPGLGEFPVRRVADYADSVPEEWAKRGGVMLPMYLREAMWLSFSAPEPAALQIGVGKVCAVSGKPWSDRLAADPQNYVVLPRQPWLDGINSGKGIIRQFVAVPLGLGATVEGQVTGEETHGGIQLQNFALNDTELARWRRAEEARRRADAERVRAITTSAPLPASPMSYSAPHSIPLGAPPPAPGSTPPRPQPGAAPRARRKANAMGLGVGGTMRQEIYKDDRPLHDWSLHPSGRIFVHLVTPPDWHHITGEAAPPSPVDRKAYTAAGLPWFDYFDSDATDLAPADSLATVAPVGDWLGDDHEPWENPTPGQIHHLGDKQGKPVEDGDW
ncbi:hypothetical protein [Nocardia seriolae]|uniref:Membrane protein n=1 Tax=Nocardia seriolae TaxID=37332 RepID=A0ABC9YT96_9NOCA|nr:hypothetical protein [Nocardia seriolae]APA96095.1 hypothetical protein NS506_02028 [Nocardia seriolae]OJF82541.1 hypothetical protein NS14008_29645 [Nocardia seriolae]PSK31506.1 hypothetical protein C6575_09900 [Nocardia seriolae]QOW33290.1 hypothetical protein IMZ23_36785 [Nocardia seriolae]QUN20964.1 hypothetical protein KEC46_18050 [Nocardia seriolae]